MGTDFFDDDLAKERENALKIKLDGADAHVPRDGFIPSSRDLPNRPIADLTLTPLARQKQEVTEQMVDKMQELDRLRARQDALEKERRTLEELRAKQEAFDGGRRELREGLNESLVRMEKDQLQSERLAQVLDETRRMFKERLEDLAELNADEWEDENLLDELNQALVRLEDIRSDYNKALAKIEAIHPSGSMMSAPAASAASAEKNSAALLSSGAQSFNYWFRAGLAFTLPLTVTLAVVALIVIAAYLWI